jgi:hypothetical protein
MPQLSVQYMIQRTEFIRSITYVVRKFKCLGKERRFFQLDNWERNSSNDNGIRILNYATSKKK